MKKNIITKLFLIIISGIVLCSSFSCTHPDRHQEVSLSKPDTVNTEVPLTEKSPEIPASPYLSQKLSEYEIRGVEFNGKKIYLPARLPRNKFRNVNTDRQKELAEAEGIYITQNRWEAEAKVVLEEMQKYDCIRSGYKIADLGGGSGYYSMIFSQMVGKSGLVYLLDVDINLLDNALQIISYNGESAGKNSVGLFYSNIVPMLTCPESTLLENESVDTVFICDIHIFHQLPNDEKHTFKNVKNPVKIRELMARTTIVEQSRIIKNIYDILKSGGNLVLIENIHYSDTVLKNDRTGIRRIFENFGFQLIADIRKLDDKEKKSHFLIFRKPGKVSMPGNTGRTVK